MHQALFTSIPGSELVLGIDEAGRGPILGPMVIACVGLTEEAGRTLTEKGVVDSKRFGAGPKAHLRRLALVPEILKVASHTALEIIDPAEIDKRTLLGELNQLEQEKAAFMLERAPKAHRIVADGARLFGPLNLKYPHLQAVNQAESAHSAVAAASILAKVKRDELWHEIVKRYRPEFGNLVGPGGGYANPGTKRFLRAYCRKYHRLPPEGRRSWPWDFVSDLLDPAEYRMLVRELVKTKTPSLVQNE